MKLYYYPISPSCRKVLGVINHLGLTVELEEMTPWSSGLRTEEFLKLNPNGKVPVLVDGDFVLWESCAIIVFLAEKVPGNDLVPVDPHQRAEMWQWIMWEAAHFTHAVSGYFLESFVKPAFLGGEPDAKVLANSLEKIDEFAPALERRLQNRPFILGNRVTLADFAVGNISEHQRMGNVPWAKYPNIQAWFDRMETVPAWAECIPPLDQNHGSS